MASTTARVSVIVPAWNAETTITRTLDALAAQEFDELFEVIVVDDGSSDGTPAAVRSHPLGARLISGERAGAGPARNRGAREARGPVLAFTDSDCFPEPGWLREGLLALDRADLVQGRVLPDPGTPRTPFDRSLLVTGQDGFFQTANLFVRRELFESLDGFSDWEETIRRRSGRRSGQPARRPVGEDTLFGWRAIRHGARAVFAPDALVHHVVLPGDLHSAILERWSWTTRMPGLARAVPELRSATFHRRWFFAQWSAQFDLAVLAVVLTAAARRRWLLLGVLPYARRLERETRPYRDGRDTRLGGWRRALRYVTGAPIVDVVTLCGLLRGSIDWRSIVL